MAFPKRIAKLIGHNRQVDVYQFGKTDFRVYLRHYGKPVGVEHATTRKAAMAKAKAWQ